MNFYLVSKLTCIKLPEPSEMTKLTFGALVFISQSDLFDT